MDTIEPMSEADVLDPIVPPPPPRRNLVRGGLGGAEFRNAEDGSESLGVMFGYFSTFNDLYEINSMWEGHFLEEVATGAFQDTFATDRAAMRSLYNHGMDAHIGNNPVGAMPPRVLEERARGPYYELDLLNTDYNRDRIVPLLRGDLMNGGTAGSQLGASFTFEVIEDSWNTSPKRSGSNPDGLPVRTITKARVFEFGPVTFPANPAATAGMRSLSDDFLSRLLGDTAAREQFESRVGKKVAERLAEAVPDEIRAAMVETVVDADRERRVKALQRQARLLVLTSA